LPPKPRCNNLVSKFDNLEIVALILIAANPRLNYLVGKV
jgi:hypothetical protein